MSQIVNVLSQFNFFCLEIQWCKFWTNIISELHWGKRSQKIFNAQSSKNNKKGATKGFSLFQSILGMWDCAAGGEWKTNFNQSMFGSNGNLTSLDYRWHWIHFEIEIPYGNFHDYIHIERVWDENTFCFGNDLVFTEKNLWEVKSSTNNL